MTATSNVIQTDFGQQPAKFARGWYCLGPEKDYSSEPQRMNYFDTSFVVYRGESGEIYILDAFCPHMGADLSVGYVDGDDIRCPFHAWKWGGDGVCNEIPYANKIPERAKIKAWPAMIENGLLFVWYDSEGNPPIEEQRIPRIDDYYSDEWSDWMFAKMHIPTHPRELIDNMADAGHFFAVHESPPTSFKNIVEGHTYTQEMSTGSVVIPSLEMKSTATYYGPSVMATFMETWFEGFGNGEPQLKRLLVTHVPVTEDSFDLRFGILMKKMSDWTEETEQEQLQQACTMTQMGFFQDVKIWENKIKIDDPVLCDGDGPVNKLRQWHQQFYMPISQVGDKWKERKEYDVRVPEKPDPQMTKHILETSEIAKWIQEQGLEF